MFGHNAAMKTIELLHINDFNFDDLKAIPEWNAEGMKMMDEMVMVSYPVSYTHLDVYKRQVSDPK